MREPYTEKKESNCQIKKLNRHQDELADRPSVAMKLKIELQRLHCNLQARPLVR
jgi:hypothetical protein